MTPVANACAMEVEKNVLSYTPLSEPFNYEDGVLWNDTAYGATPSVVLVTGPAHATVFNLYSNGSARYRSVSTYTGTDSFTYKVWDGTAFSNVATVTITVVAGASWSHPHGELFLDK